MNEDAEDWLRRYKAAWEQADCAGVLELFTPDGIYLETPYSRPFAGHGEIGTYWREVVRDGQRDIRFTFSLLARVGNMAVAHWRATFRNVADDRHVALDGMFRLTFAEGGPPLRCRRFEEWWHVADSHAPPDRGMERNPP